MDFIVELHQSCGFDFISVIFDRLTKQAQFLPCNENITAADTDDLYLKHIFKLQGLTQETISDRGPQFRSCFYRFLFSPFCVQSKFTSSYHPETDGQTERVKQVFGQYIRCFTSYKQTIGQIAYDLPSLSTTTLATKLQAFPIISLTMATTLV